MGTPHDLCCQYCHTCTRMTTNHKYTQLATTGSWWDATGGGQLVSNIVNSQTVMEFYQNYNIDKFQTARCTFVCVSFGHNSNLEVTAQYFDVKTLKED